MISTFFTFSLFSQEPTALQSAMEDLFYSSDFQQKEGFIENFVEKGIALDWIFILSRRPGDLEDFEVEFLINKILLLVPISEEDEKVMPHLTSRFWETTDLRKTILLRINQNREYISFITETGNYLNLVVRETKGYPPLFLHEEIRIYIEVCKNFDHRDLNRGAVQLLGTLRTPKLTQICLNIWENP